MKAWLRLPRCVYTKSQLQAVSRRSRQRSLHDTSQPPSIARLLQQPAKDDDPATITVNGFVRSVRTQKRVAFATIGDGSSVEPLQAVLSPEQANGLSNGAAVSLRGNHASSLAGKEQASELRVSEVQILGGNDAAAYPIQKKYHTLEYLRTLPHLRARTPPNSLLLRLRSRLIAETTRFFDQEGYVQTHTPIITSSDCEGAGEVFQVQEAAALKNGTSTSSKQEKEFFESPKYLTVSSQLHLEALAQAVGKVWTLSPTFRAEKSDTARHLSEFYMLEAELCFTDRLEDIMALVEKLLKSLTGCVADSKLGQELIASHSNAHEWPAHDTEKPDLRRRWEGLLRKEWTRMTYQEAIEKLQGATTDDHVKFSSTVDASSGLQTEHEKYLAETFGKGGPVFVTDYPQAIKPFYMAPSGNDSDALGPLPTAACFDLLLPDICEVVGGSMREHRLGPLEDAMLRKGLLRSPDGKQRETQSLDWYLDLRRYGSVPHGGFGLGFDRLLGYLAGVRNIRDVVSFPRWYGRCVC